MGLCCVSLCHVTSMNICNFLVEEKYAWLEMNDITEQLILQMTFTVDHMMEPLAVCLSGVELF